QHGSSRWLPLHPGPRRGSEEPVQDGGTMAAAGRTSGHAVGVSELDLPQNVHAVLTATEQLRETVPGIIAIALVGSWARSQGRPDSDVDLVVLTSEPAALLDEGAVSWFSVFGEGAELVRSEDFGPLQERRLRRRDGLEVEVG